MIVSETGNPAYSPTNSFIYDRTQDEFEQVMAYYWITEAQKYIQSLGFGTRYRAVNKEPQRVRINQWGADNSFATTHKDELRFGKGGVDDAEDAEVILHEYGHAIHFSQNFAFASVEAGAISEGFGDYWAVTGDAGHLADRGPRVRRGLGLRLLHRARPALPAPHRQRSALPGEPRRSGPRRWTDLVARALGHQELDRQREGGHRHPRGPVRLRRHDDDRPRDAGRSPRPSASTAIRPRTRSAPRSKRAASSTTQRNGHAIRIVSGTDARSLVTDRAFARGALVAVC